jgi:ankyrin repeat protein
MKSILNFRDHKGRTPLHIAAIWANKEACETLLYLKANCLIKDGNDFKPVDYVDPNSSLADLFKNWMPRTTPPTLECKFGEINIPSTQSASGATLKSKVTKKPVNGPSLELEDLR